MEPTVREQAPRLGPRGQRREHNRLIVRAPVTDTHGPHANEPAPGEWLAAPGSPREEPWGALAWASPWRQVCNLQGVQGLYPQTLAGANSLPTKLCVRPRASCPPVKAGVPGIHPKVPPDTNSSQNLHGTWVT